MRMKQTAVWALLFECILDADKSYFDRLDEKEAQRAADEFLKEHGRGQIGSAPNEHASRRKSAAAGSQNLKNTSVYVTGLTTYVACKQLGTLVVIQCDRASSSDIHRIRGDGRNPVCQDWQSPTYQVLPRRARRSQSIPMGLIAEQEVSAVSRASSLAG
jgi:hypothetical protein